MKPRRWHCYSDPQGGSERRTVGRKYEAPALALLLRREDDPQRSSHCRKYEAPTLALLPGIVTGGSPSAPGRKYEAPALALLPLFAWRPISSVRRKYEAPALALLPDSNPEVREFIRVVARALPGN